MARFRTSLWSALVCLGLSLPALQGCGNNPYPKSDARRAIHYRILAEDPKTLDPTVSYTNTEAYVVDVIYPSFFQYNYLKIDPVELEPNLGAEMPTREDYVFEAEEDGQKVRKTGEVWTFRIREDLRFQDDPCFEGGKGRKVTAHDFIYSFKRMGDPAMHSPVLGFVQDKIIGMQEYVEYNRKRLDDKQSGDYAFPIKGLQVDPQNPHVFRIFLNQKYPQLKYLMAMHFTTPIPREAVEKYGEDFKTHPVGCGPYMMKEYKRRRSLTLVKNPNYYPDFYPSEGMPGDAEAGLLADAGKQLPLLDEVHFTISRETVTAWNLFIQGYLDSAAVNRDNFQQVVANTGSGLSEEMVRKGLVLREAAGMSIFYYAFNMDDPVVGGNGEKQKKLRKAISKSIDNQTYIDLFLIGLGVPAESPLPPQLEGYDPDYVNPNNTFDLEEAKRLLAEAGYPNGINEKTGDRLTLYFDNGAGNATARQMVDFVVRSIERLGIDVQSRTSRPNVWQDKVRKGEFQFISYGWLADYPDPENFLFLFYGPNVRPAPNYANYQNKRYDRLFEQMRAMDESPERTAIIHEMRDILAEDSPWHYTFHQVSWGLYQPWLKNVKTHPVSKDVTKYYNIDTEKRAQLWSEWNRPNHWPWILTLAAFVGALIPAANVVKRRRNRRIRKGPGRKA